MQAHHPGERTLTELDHARLSKLPAATLPAELADILGHADVIHSREMPADIVTMYSQVELVDVASRRQQKLTICFPRDSAPAAGLVSVLSPIGSALLGLKVGAIARWRMPGGDEAASEVVAVVYQPEASGDYLT